MDDPIFKQLVALMKDLGKAMKDIEEILDDLRPIPIIDLKEWGLERGSNNPADLD
jgi:hypothetical protein